MLYSDLMSFQFKIEQFGKCLKKLFMLCRILIRILFAWNKKNLLKRSKVYYL